METRDLIVKVPEPDEDIGCSNNCPIYETCKYGIERKGKRKLLFWRFPGPGCPWYEGGKDG